MMPHGQLVSACVLVLIHVVATLIILWNEDAKALPNISFC